MDAQKYQRGQLSFLRILRKIKTQYESNKGDWSASGRSRRGAGAPRPCRWDTPRNQIIAHHNFTLPFKNLLLKIPSRVRCESD